MKTERIIAIYDNDTNLQTDEINVDHIDLEQLKACFNPPSDDPFMHSPYTISEDQSEALHTLLGDEIEFDFTANTYILECYLFSPDDFTA